MNQPDPRPTHKIAAAGIGGAVATIIVAVLNAYGVSLDPSVVAAIVTLAAFGAGYLRPEK